MIFEVDRSDLRSTRATAPPDTALADGQVRLAVERFAFTSNNVSYAVAGDLLDYWGFFPAEAPWGRIPAIGLGKVVESANPDIEVGGRWFGFYPMGDELVITAERRRGGFRDTGAHRAQHAATYTDFRDISADPTFDLGRVDQYLLLYGMFMTSWLVDDQLGDRNFDGATATIVTSASSKTSISLASCLAERDVAAIGLTSERNRSFVEGLGLYDEVATYDAIDQLDATTRTGIVDMAGNTEVRAEVHRHFGDALAFSTSVGATHWEQTAGDAGPLPGPSPQFFFAPAQVAKRVDEWGNDELQVRIMRSYERMVDHSDGWLHVEHRQGPDGIEATYRDLIEGRADPASGFVCAMHTEELS